MPKISRKSAKDLAKIRKVGHQGGQQPTKCAARQNVRGPRGGKEGLKPLRVWQGSWARSLDPGIWGLEIWDLAKPDRNLHL